MNYIKLFNEKFITSDKWEVISIDNFWKMVEDHKFILSTFTNTEYDGIQNLVTPLLRNDIFQIDWSGTCYTSQVLMYNLDKDNTIIEITHGLNKTNAIEIWKLEDEWYLVIDHWNGYPKYDSSIVKCDQYDGLIEYLEKFMKGHNLENYIK
jgi:hypothetical protein